ncbi:MAG TPA: hypothetical protein PL110_05500 [Candidatus Eremiobacteraeota bacterium]|nr:MAG: hypothetical protein BWY64_02500 [bacterium ADurb.Bin363]HPZ07547.1 hypothetical protein [Candidatus Eremiobacteraeota bacterium]
MRKVVVFILLFFLILLSLPLSHSIAQNTQVELLLNPNITMELYPGFEEYYKTYNWFCVTLMVTNSGPYFKGELVVKNFNYNNEYTTSMRKYIELPTNTLKKFQIYLSPDFTHSWRADFSVELVDMSGKLFFSTKKSVKLIDKSQTLVLVLSKDKGGLNYLTGPQTNLWPNSNLLILYPDITCLPDRWIGYDGVDIIIINNFSLLDSLDSVQQKALEEWLNMGGKLLISSSGNPIEFSNTFLDKVLPLEFKSNIILPKLNSFKKYSGHSINIDLPGISVVQSSIKPEVYAKILLQEDNIPLITTSYAGNGKITYLAFDISKEPFKNWDNKMKFWAKILRDLYFDSILPVKLTAEEGNHILYDIPSLKPPSFSFLGIYLFIYIICIGPMNYFILKRFDKREFTIITIPVMIFFFSMGTYLIGYTSKGGSIIQREISIVKLNEASSFANIDTFISLFSPNKSNYKIDFQKSNIWPENITPTSYDYPLYTILKEGEKNSIENINLNMWSIGTFRAFSGRSLADGFYVNNLEINIDNKTGDIIDLKGTIINKTGKNLEDLCLIYNSSQIAYIGKIKKEINNFQVNFNSRVLNGIELTNYWSDKCNLKEDKIQDKLKKNLSGKVMESLFAKQSHGLILLGWNEEPLEDININRVAKKEVLNLFLINILIKDHVK